MKAPALPDQSVEELLQQAEQLESMRMWDLVEQRRNEAKVKQQPDAGKSQITLNWHELVNELAAASDVRHSILDYNRYANPEFFGGSDNSLTLAGLLLLREFASQAEKPEQHRNPGAGSGGLSGAGSGSRRTASLGGNPGAQGR